MNIEYEKKTELTLRDLMRTNTTYGLAGRTGIGSKAALLAVLLGGLSFAAGAYGGVVIVGGPPVLVVPEPVIRVVVPEPVVVVRPPWPGFWIFGGDYDRRHDAHEYGDRGFRSRGEAHHDDERRKR
jgi:hypothetical protein